MNLSPITGYAILGAIAGFFLSKKRRGKLGQAMKGAALGAAAAWGAPRVGVKLPGLPAPRIGT